MVECKENYQIINKINPLKNGEILNFIDKKYDIVYYLKKSFLVLNYYIVKLGGTIIAEFKKDWGANL